MHVSLVHSLTAVVASHSLTEEQQNSTLQTCSPPSAVTSIFPAASFAALAVQQLLPYKIPTNGRAVRERESHRPSLSLVLLFLHVFVNGCRNERTNEREERLTARDRIIDRPQLCTTYCATGSHKLIPSPLFSSTAGHDSLLPRNKHSDKHRGGGRDHRFFYYCSNNHPIIVSKYRVSIVSETRLVILVTIIQAFT